MKNEKMLKQTDVEKRVVIESNDKVVIKPRVTIIPKLSKHIPKMPIFISKHNKITLCNSQNGNFLLKNIQPMKNIYTKQAFREEIIYKSKEGDFLKGNPQQAIIIMNRLDLTNNNCKTIAQFISHSDNSVLSEKTSASVTKVIGQENFDLVLSALLSVINQETKVRAIMGLLVEDKNEPVPKERQKTVAEKCCQTDINCMDVIYKIKQKKRIKRSQLIPYVVKDSPVEKKRVVVNPKVGNTSDDTEDVTMETTEKLSENLQSNLPEIKLFNEDSNASTSSIGNISTLSGISMKFRYNSLLDNPTEIFEQIDQCTDQAGNNLKLVPQQLQLPESQQRQQNPSPSSSDAKKILTHRATVQNPTKVQESSPQGLTTIHQRVQDNFSPTCITMSDGTQIMVPVKPEDHFHIATPEILRNVTVAERKKLLWCQAYIDWTFCLHRDEHDNL